MSSSLRAAVSVAAVLLPVGALAHRAPVEWSAVARDRAAGAVTITVRGTIERGWFIYGMEQPADGPTPLRFTVGTTTLASNQVGAPVPRTSYDRGFRARVAKYTGSPAFVLPLRLPEDASSLRVEVRYQACNDDVCLPPTTRRLDVAIGPEPNR